MVWETERKRGKNKDRERERENSIHFYEIFWSYLAKNKRGRKERK